MPEYVTAAELQAILGPGADAGRVALAVDAANALVAAWCPQAAIGDPPAAPDAPVTPVTRQAGHELAHQLYRTHTAVGGVFGIDDLLARLPADRVKGIRDLLDAETHVWGMA